MNRNPAKSRSLRMRPVNPLQTSSQTSSQTITDRYFGRRFEPLTLWARNDNLNLHELGSRVVEIDDAFADGPDEPLRRTADAKRSIRVRAVSLKPSTLLSHKATNPSLHLTSRASVLAFKGQVWKNGFAFVALIPAAKAGVKSIMDLLKQNLERVNSKFKMTVRALPLNGQYPALGTGVTPFTLNGNKARVPRTSR